MYSETSAEGLKAREKVYEPGQSKLRADHEGSKYRYDVYEEEKPAAEEVSKDIET